MKYVALLRGINVGGKNKIAMFRLKAVFESIGHSDVTTYINTGNIVFVSVEPADKLSGNIEAAIQKEFDLTIRVLIVPAIDIQSIAKNVPTSWANDKENKCDVLFLWETIDSKAILDLLSIKDGIDEVKYFKGALIWRVNRSMITRSGLMKIAGSDIYQNMTVRNINTVRKLALLTI